MFYDGDLKEAYKSGSGWPKDCLQVSEDVFNKYVNEPPEGKNRIAGADSFPSWGDIPPPTPDEIIA